MFGMTAVSKPSASTAVMSFVVILSVLTTCDSRTSGDQEGLDQREQQKTTFQNDSDLFHLLPLAEASFWNDLSRKRPKGGIDVSKHSKEARLFNIFSSASEDNAATDIPPSETGVDEVGRGAHSFIFPSKHIITLPNFIKSNLI